MSLRAPIAVMAAIVMVASACSGNDARAHPYSAQSAAIGESLSILGWNISVTNLRFDADYVLVDVDASPSQKEARTPNSRTSASGSTARWRIRSRPTPSAAAKP
jgi:hypothetical protein